MLSNVQDYLSLGYLYLLLLGIISDSIFWSFLGINIVNYSNILDILLSPIIYLGKGPAFAAVILLAPILMFGINYLQVRKKQAKHKSSERTAARTGTNSLNKLKYLGPALVILAAYIGYAFGSGSKMAERLQSGALHPDHNITFFDGETVEAKLIGHNSLYVFYATENQREVTIAPIQGNVKRMVPIRKKEED